MNQACKVSVKGLALRRSPVRIAVSRYTSCFLYLRLSFILGCPSTADESSPAPEKQLASNVAVKFGQYDNTDNWYADVSWSPINGV